jgi:hypothetical protein
MKLSHILLSLLLFLPYVTSAQVDPPKPIAIYISPSQNLSFGAFIQGTTGGTVAVDPYGGRTVTGSIIQANMGVPFSPASFEIEANPGTIINILNGPDVQLTGSNGGSLTLHLDAADVTSPFIINTAAPARTTVRIGGTLTVGTPIANPAGSYSGTFVVTFIQE